MFEHATTARSSSTKSASCRARCSQSCCAPSSTAKIQRVGSLESKRVDVRVVAATNRDLLTQCADGRFRSDLDDCLSVVELRPAAARERLGDIPYLTAAFIRELSARLGRPITG